MGSHTYNNVYGTTVNPYDVSKSAGGSSGGAAAALAAGMVPIADGGDLGGSLRNPGSFNNVVGFRPSAGLVPNAPNPLPFFGLDVKGPLARSVSDAALLLSVIAGSDPRDPVCFSSEPRRYAQDLSRDFRGVRVAWCPDLGGLPLDRRVRAVLDRQRSTLEGLGCLVDDRCPDLTDADDVFLTLRRWRSATVYGPLVEPHRREMKPEAIAEIEAGLTISGADVGRAMLAHGQLLDRVRRFQETYEFLVCSVSQVPPFDRTLRWPKAIEGVAMDHYVSWMKSAYWISATLCPAISVPAGFTADGLPVGLQIVGRFRDDLGVLQLAHAFEQVTGFGARRPNLPEPRPEKSEI
jgi:amidase